MPKQVSWMSIITFIRDRLRIFPNRYIWFAFSVAIAIWFVYLARSIENMIYTDQYRLMITIVGKYLEGTLNFGDIWSPYAEHRIITYNLLFLLNAIVFDLDTRIESLASVIIAGITSWLILKCFVRTSIPDTSSPLVRGAVAMPIILCLFSLAQYDMLTWSIGVHIFFLTLVFVGGFVLLDEALLGHRVVSRTALVAGIFVPVGILFVGGGYSPAFVSALMVAVGVMAISTGAWRRALRIGVPLGAVVLASYSLYLSGFADAGEGSSRLAYVVAHMIDAIKFALIAAGTSLTGLALGAATLGENLTAAIGVFVLAVYGVALTLYFRLRLYDRTYMPILLMSFSLGCILLFTVGRLHYGAGYGAQPRYTVETVLGLAAVAWVLGLAVLRLQHRVVRGTLVTALGLLMIIILAVNFAEWRMGPYRQAYMARLAELARIIAHDPAMLSEKDYAPFNAANPEEVRKAVALARDYRLNIFANIAAETPGTVYYGSGWSSKDNSGRWLGPRATALVFTDEIGEIEIDAFWPEWMGAKSIKIQVDNEPSIQWTIQPGRTTLDIPAPSAQTLRLTIEVTPTQVPSALGHGNDSRELGILVRGLLGA